jgi:hypothetical protein
MGLSQKQLSQFSVDELRLLRHKYLSDMPTDEADDARIRRTIKRINQALEVKQLIAEFHKNRLVPSTEKIFRNAKRKANDTRKKGNRNP